MLMTISGCSVARLSRLLWEQEVAGSNPATPTKKIQSRKWLDFLFLDKRSIAPKTPYIQLRTCPIAFPFSVSYLI